MADIVIGFLFIAGIVFAGFLGTLFFQRTRFSDFVLLMVLGVLVGPVFNLLGSDAIGFFRSITPFFASLALMILLFEGGLQLNFFVVLRELTQSTIFTASVFVLNILLCTGALFVLGWPFELSVLLGTILGGTSSAVIVPMVAGSSAQPRTKTLLTIESAITDVLCVVTTIAIGQVLVANTLQVQGVVTDLLSAFSIAAVLGFIFAIVWLKVLRDVTSTQPYQYVLTLAVLFVLYALTEYSNGNGAFSALMFGLVIGNAGDIGKLIGMREVKMNGAIAGFQKEISLFVRTFFFVYMGIIFDVYNLDVGIVLTAAVLTGAFVLARMGGVHLLLKRATAFLPDKTALEFLMARGLAAAVLATYPLSLGLFPEYAERILQVSFLVIVFSNLISTAGLFVFEQGAAKRPAEKSGESERPPGSLSPMPIVVPLTRSNT